MLCVSSVGDDPSVYYGDVYCEQQNDEDIVEQSEDSEHRLWDDVERWDEVQKSCYETDKNPEAKHPNKATEWEELPKYMSEQSWEVVYVVHELER